MNFRKFWKTFFDVVIYSEHLYSWSHEKWLNENSRLTTLYSVGVQTDVNTKKTRD